LLAIVWSPVLLVRPRHAVDDEETVPEWCCRLPVDRRQRFVSHPGPPENPEAGSMAAGFLSDM